MRARGIDDPRLFAAIEATPRQSFLASAWSHLAYSTRTAPLDCGEYIEGIDDQARVLAALKLEPGHRVLEIGTGSGFTAAVMSSLSGRVTTVERYRKLCDHALQQFVSLKRENIMVKHADDATACRAGRSTESFSGWLAKKYRAISWSCWRRMVYSSRRSVLVTVNRS